MPGTRDEDQIYIYYIKISPLPFALLLFWLLVCLPTSVPQANTHLMTFAFVVYSSWNAQLLNALMDHFFFFFLAPLSSCLIVILRKTYLGYPI